MNWEAIGAVGEVGGAIGVIVTLIYLATQIRQNTRTIRLTAYDSFQRSVSEAQRSIASDPELSRINRTGLDTPDELDAAEQERFRLLLYSVFIGFQQNFFSSQTQSLPSRNAF